MSIEKSVCLAISIIADAKIANTSVDRTITCYIKELIDETSGKYLVQYEDSLFEAYATSNTIFYEEGQQVSVLIPSDNGVRTILSSKDIYAANYTEVTKNNTSNKFNQIGPNAISLEKSFTLSSYKTETIELYNIENEEEDNSFSIDQENVKYYIQQGDGIHLSAVVQTMFDMYQTGGLYGVIFELEFLDDKTKSAATVPYIISSRDLIGNPYAVIKPTKIEHLFNEVETGNFNCIKSISIFVKDFAIQDSEKLNIKDITFSNIQLVGAEVLTTLKLEGYTVHLNYSTNGNILKKDNSINTVTFLAELKSQGKTITDNVEYYWFREDARVLEGNPKYCSKGGYGWLCLNNYTSDGKVVAAGSKIIFTNDESIVEKAHPIIPIYDIQGNPTLETSINENVTDPLTVLTLQRNTNIKCVAVKGIIDTEGFSTVIDEQKKNIYINSSDKIGGTDENQTIYYRDSGSPTLTCVWDEKEDEKEDNYTYVWSVLTNRGLIINKLSTDEINEAFNIAQNTLIETEANYNSMDEVGKELYYNTLLDAQKEFNKYNIERIDKDTYYNFPIKDIYGSSRVLCAVTKDNVYLGTGSIILENHMTLQDTYSLVLENSSQVFQYDGKGNSPASEQLLKPITILPLSFKLFDDSGNEISYEQIINNGYIEWLVPKNNTLLIPLYSPTSAEYLYGNDLALAADFDIYKDNAALKNALADANYKLLSSFPFTIAPSFDENKTSNYIRLDVKYNDFLFTAYSNFTFPKEGDPGTNGTNKLAKIIPCLVIENEDGELIEENELTGSRLYYNNTNNDFYTEDGYKFDKLKFLLYNNGKRLEDVSSLSVYWTIPPDMDNVNNQSSLYGNNSHFVINANGVLSKNSSEFTGLPIDIVRGRYTEQDLKYLAEIPICYTETEDNTYRLKLKQKSGFQYVVYENDGTSPNYDDTLPFEVIVLKLINLKKTEEDEDQLYYIAQDTNLYTYTWTLFGGQLEEDSTKEAELYQYWCKPIDNGFDSSQLSNGINVEVRIKETEDKIGNLSIPIYMIINRYGQAKLNAWDGNAISLKEGGDIILSPQVGAGKKDALTNTFTGILIGLQKSSPGSTSSETGLFGYGKGERSIFLDADTGNATFGKSGAGQIKIDAESGLGTIASGDYPSHKETIDGQTVDVPSGMKIKFSSDGLGEEQGPYIKYGNNNFAVNYEGHIHAAGGGDIAGWDIDNDKISKHDSTGLTGMAAQNWPASSIGGNYPTSTSPVAFYAATINDGSTVPNFYVTHDGHLYSQSGKIGSWNINENNLTNGNVGLGTPSISIAFAYGTSNSTTLPASSVRLWSDNNFIVTNNGKIYANLAQLGPWALSTSALTNSNVGIGLWNGVNLNPAFGVSLTKNLRFWSGSSTVANGLNFVVDDTGKLYSKDGRIGGWTISKDTLSSNNITIQSGENGYIAGKYSSGNKTGWSIGNDGKATFYQINAAAGTIGGCNITANGITSTATFGTNNTPIWYINKDGTATFNNIEATGGKIGGVNINSTSIYGTGFSITPTSAYFTGLQVNSSGGISSSNIGGISGTNSCGFDSSGAMYANPGSLLTSSNGTQTLGAWLSATFDELMVGKTFIYSGVTAQWQSFYAIESVALDFIDTPVTGGTGTVRVPYTINSTGHNIYALCAKTS